MAAATASDDDDDDDAAAAATVECAILQAANAIAKKVSFAKREKRTEAAVAVRARARLGVAAAAAAAATAAACGGGREGGRCDERWNLCSGARSFQDAKWSNTRLRGRLPRLANPTVSTASSPSL